MMPKCRTRRNCRLCGSYKAVKVLSLTPTPPANAFVSQRQLGSTQERYPLNLRQCLDCGHVQLSEIIDPRILFENYVYVSGTSPVFVRHFEDYAKSIVSEYRISKGGFVLDIGSNDGTLLRFFQELGMEVLGVDPAVDIARKATESGVETLPRFFSAELADTIRVERRPASIITANNVFAHANDLAGFVQGVRNLLAQDGLFVFEVSYLLDVYEKTFFDTIYHEHLSYHTVGPLERFFNAHGMDLIDAVRVDTHGGSLRGVVQRIGGPRKKRKSVSRLIRLESQRGLYQPGTLRRFGKEIVSLKRRLQHLLRRLKENGARIAGYGAPAKATTLMYHFELGADILDFIIDDSPLKQGLYSPGLHIPVLASSALYEKEPDYLLILAWNFADPIIEKNQAYREAGGRFIVPLPNIQVR